MAKKIADTKKLTHEEWVTLRKSGIGGSDAAAVIGMNPYSSAITVYANKKDLSKEIEDNEAMRQGRDFEAYAAMRYTEKTGKAVRNDNFMYCDDTYDFLIANIDRRIVGENAGLEIKTMSSFNGYNLEGNEIPPQYYVQCQHYIMVMGFDYMDLAVLVYQKGLYVIRIDRNDDFIRDMRQSEVAFWTDSILNNQIPAPDGSDASIETLKELYPTAKADSEIEILGLDEMIEEYKALSDLAKDYKERQEAAKAKICAIMGDYEVGIGDNYGCSWKNQSKETVDTKALKEQYPAIYAKVVKTSDYRVFRTKKFKKKGA